MAVQKVLFLSPDSVKEQSALNINIDNKDLEVHILKTQDLCIQPLIGTQLFERIREDIINNTLVEPYSGLVDNYLNDVLVNESIRRALPFIFYSINRKGINTFSDEYSESVQHSELNHLQNIFKSDSEFYQQRTVDYLYHHSEKFPEFQTGKDDDMLPEYGSTYSPNVYLPGNHNRYPDWYGNFPNNGNNE